MADLYVAAENAISEVERFQNTTKKGELVGQHVNLRFAIPNLPHESLG